MHVIIQQIFQVTVEETLHWILGIQEQIIWCPCLPGAYSLMVKGEKIRRG